MYKSKPLLLGAIAALSLTSSNAFALLDANLPGTTNIDVYDVKYGNLFLDDINQINFSGYVLSDFGATGAPNVVGSVFTDYIFLKATSGIDQFSGSQSSCLGSTCQFTVVGSLTGEITSTAGAFKFNSLDSLDFFYSSTNDAGFSTTAAIANFSKGDNVLSGDSLGKLTSLPTPNTGALTPTVGAQGSFNFQYSLLEGVDGNALYAADGVTSLFDLVSPSTLFGLTEGQITLQLLKAAGTTIASTTATGTNKTITQNIVDFLGIASPNGVLLTTVQSSPTVNLASQVPEPATLALLGIGLIASTRFSNRKSA